MKTCTGIVTNTDFSPRLDNAYCGVIRHRGSAASDLQQLYLVRQICLNIYDIYGIIPISVRFREHVFGRFCYSAIVYHLNVFGRFCYSAIVYHLNVFGRFCYSAIVYHLNAAVVRMAVFFCLCKTMSPVFITFHTYKLF